MGSPGGEVFRPVQIGEALLRQWCLGAYAWRQTELAQGWIAKDGSTQVRIFFDLNKSSVDYYSDCISHDAYDSWTDHSSWFRDAIFRYKTLLNDIAQFAEGSISVTLIV